MQPGVVCVGWLAGAQVLDGLLLIGWTASYNYIAMERFWTQTDLPM